MSCAVNKPDSCAGCPLIGAPGPIWGEGPPNARLVVIGQNPGSEEVKEGRPFIGASGRVLAAGLSRNGISRDRLFVTNAVKCWTSPGSFIPPLAIEKCKPLLAKELSCLPNMKSILTVGAEAFFALTKGKKFTTTTNKKDGNAWLRGAVYPFNPERRQVIVPTMHPSYLMRMGFKESYIFDSDIAKAFRFANEGGNYPWVETYNYNPSTAEVIEYVSECEHAEVGFGLDIETPMISREEEEELTPDAETKIEVIGISARYGECIGVQPDQFELLRPLFDTARERPVTMFDFNDGFDRFHLLRRFSMRGVRSMDVMLALHLLYSEMRPKDLGMALAMFTDMPYHKNMMQSAPDLYNARDTYGAREAGLFALRELERYGMLETFWKYTMPLVDIVWAMRRPGVNVDKAVQQKLLLRLHMQLQAYETFWNKTLPFVSWSSPKQLLDYFTGPCKLPVQYVKVASGPNKGKNRPSVNDDALELYSTRYNNKVAGLVQAMRTLKKSNDLIDITGSDGRIHPIYKIHGQKGHRIQAKSDGGGNLQQIPDKMGSDIYPRTIVIPDNPEEDEILVADFNQIELRLYGAQAGSKKMLEEFATGDYIYGFYYEAIFDRPFFKDGMPRTKQHISGTVQPWEVLVAKSFPLGWIYGRSVGGMVTAHVDKSRAERVFRALDSSYPEVPAFHKTLLAKAQRDGYLLTPFGRMRRFPNVKGSHNEILAFPGQSTAVDILIRNALLPFFYGEEARALGIRFLFTVHDSVIMNVKKARRDETYQFVKRTMEQPFAELNGLSIPVEIKLGPSWGGAKVYYGAGN